MHRGHECEIDGEGNGAVGLDRINSVRSFKKGIQGQCVAKEGLILVPLDFCSS